MGRIAAAEIPGWQLYCLGAGEAALVGLRLWASPGDCTFWLPAARWLWLRWWPGSRVPEARHDYSQDTFWEEHF